MPLLDRTGLFHNESMNETDSNTATSPGAPRPAWRGALDRFSLLFTAAVALPAVAGFAARWWWGFELTSHFRLQYFWGLLIGTALLAIARQWRIAAAAGGLLAIHAALLAPFYLPAAARPAGTGRLRVLSLNVLGPSINFPRVIDFVRQADPDVAVFVEVTHRWGDELAALDDRWPYSYTHARSDLFGVAIYSRIPFEARHIAALSESCPAIVAKIPIGEQPLTIFGVHPYRPLIGAGTVMRDRQLGVLADLVVDAGGPVVVVGDLNATSWSPGFSDFIARSGLRDSRAGLGVQPTWPAPLPAPLRIPIDHCLVSSEITVLTRQAGPPVGSDHLPVIADLAIAIEGNHEHDR